MRLTDLLKNADSAQRTPSVDGADPGDTPAEVQVPKHRERTITRRRTVHLAVSDLASLMDTGTEPQRRAPAHTPPPTVNAPAAHQRTGILSRPHVGAAGTMHAAPVQQAPAWNSVAIPAPGAYGHGKAAQTFLPTGPGCLEPVEDPDTAAADSLHIEITDLLDDLYIEGRDGRPLSMDTFIDPLQRLIEFCETSNAILRKAVRLKTQGGSFATHAINLSILAIKIGMARKFEEQRLFDLALCGLLHDIGMMKVDKDILGKAGKLTKEEMLTIWSHVEQSGQVLAGLTPRYPMLVPTVQQVHERVNGSGYPRGLKGQDIHEYARIVGMCDVYIALTEPKVNREKYSGYMALQQIIARRGIDFEAKIIKTLIDVISVFPLESLVKLNNGSIGRVVGIHQTHPTRPLLLILVDGDGHRITEPCILDLEQEPLLYIEDPDIEEGVVL